MTEPGTDQAEVLRLHEAAEFVRVSEKTLRHLAREGRIPCQKVGREWRFLKTALRNWLVGDGGSRIGKARPRQGRLFPDVTRRERPPKGAPGFGDTAFTRNRDEPLHRWVPWIAGFSSDFVGGILDSGLGVAPSDARVLDPFAGVGTTLVEGMKRGFNVVGFEINPYAALVSQVKLESPGYNVKTLRRTIHQLRDFVYERTPKTSLQPSSGPPGEFRSRVPFFSPAIERQVLFVLDFVSTRRSDWIKRVLKIALGSVMVGFSNYSYEPSLSTRAAAGKPNVEQADVAEILSRKLMDMADDIEFLHEQLATLDRMPKAILCNESYLIGAGRLGRETVDVLITSPPYLNNYHYVRNTRPHLFWLGLVDERRCLTSLAHTSFGKFWQTVRASSEVALDVDDAELRNIVDRVREQNPGKRQYGGPGWANYVATYFNDCARFSRVTADLMKKGGKVIVVIGNNIIQGVEIETDKLLAKIAGRHGLETIGLHRVRTKRTGSSIVNSSVRAGTSKTKAHLYETAVELRAT